MGHPLSVHQTRQLGLLPEDLSWPGLFGRAWAVALCIGKEGSQSGMGPVPVSSFCFVIGGTNILLS